MVWYRVIIVSALSQRKRVKRERELDNCSLQVHSSASAATNNIVITDHATNNILLLFE